MSRKVAGDNDNARMENGRAGYLFLGEGVH